MLIRIIHRRNAQNGIIALVAAIAVLWILQPTLAVVWQALCMV